MTDSVRASFAPVLSVVIIRFASAAHLRRSLDALLHQSQTADVEILVPHDDTLVEARALTAEYPSVRFLSAGARLTPAALRTIGTLHSRAPIVGFLEDHCCPAPGWVARVVAAHVQPHAAIGGTIEKAFPPGRTDDTRINWAIYFTDYSRYMPPMEAGPAHGLSDCNVSYKRAALDRIGDVWSQEFHENLVNDGLAALGAPLWFDPEMTVLEQRDLSLAGALHDRFSFGRLFGSSRVKQASFAKRVAMGGAALVMTPLLVFRVANNLRARGRYLWQFARCLPLLFMVAGAWMVGEATGYVTGTAGKGLTPSDS